MPKPVQLFRQSPGDPNSDAGENSLRIFTLAEGVLMLVLGTLALIFPLVASVWVTGVVAMVFLVAGLISWINTLGRARQLDALFTFWRLVVATLLLLSGVWMVGRLASGPSAAASQVAALALGIGVVFLIEGAVATVVSLSNRQVRGWGWGLVNGLVTLMLGVFILSLKAFNLVWVLGVLVGISFLFSGVDLLTFHASFHSTPNRHNS
jgi:uncharacterized membrane protein HdeD (DUF308 family)